MFLAGALVGIGRVRVGFRNLRHAIGLAPSRPVCKATPGNLKVGANVVLAGVEFLGEIVAAVVVQLHEHGKGARGRGGRRFRANRDVTAGDPCPRLEAPPHVEAARGVPRQPSKLTLGLATAAARRRFVLVAAREGSNGVPKQSLDGPRNRLALGSPGEVPVRRANIGLARARALGRRRARCGLRRGQSRLPAAGGLGRR